VGKLYSVVPIVAQAIISTVKADGFNVGQNNGIAANQIIPHVHIHIVPRFTDDSPDGRWPPRKVAPLHELQELAEKISQKIAIVSQS
jgi:histidine triad (HIT) family protein